MPEVDRFGDEVDLGNKRKGECDIKNNGRVKINNIGDIPFLVCHSFILHESELYKKSFCKNKL